VSDRQGLGMLGMKERVTLLGGTIHICSAPGQGTQIEIRIPLANTEVIRA
jgi:signal transduction histidine kinase